MRLPFIVLASLSASCLAKNINEGFYHVEFNISRGDTFQSSSPSNKPRFVRRTAPDGTVLTDIENQSTFYSVELQIGSQNTKVVVLIDTGSSDLWVSGSENPYCEPGTATGSSQKFRKIDDSNVFNEVFGTPESDKFRKILTDEADIADFLIQKRDAFRNFDDAAAIATILDNKDDSTPLKPSGTVNKDLSIQSSSSAMATIDCSTYGVFDHNSSTSFKSNNTDFFILYGDETYAAGTWGVDNVNVGGLEVKDFSFAVANQSNSSMGVLGIGLPGLETTNTGALAGDTPYTYENLPVKLVADGLIHKNVYSLWLNSWDQSSGSVLFGGVDHAKYSGQLQLVPVINTLARYYNDPIKLEVTLSSISFKNKVVTSQSYPALLDSGTTLTYFPNSVIASIASAIGAKYSSTYGYYMLECPSSSDTTNLTYTFQGIDINVPLSDVVLQADRGSSACVLAMLDSGEDHAILGDSFLRSAYVVYDLDDFQIGLAQAVYTSAENIDVITSTIPSAVSAPSYSATYGGQENSSGYYTPLGTAASGSAGALTASRSISGSVTGSTSTRTSATASASSTSTRDKSSGAGSVNVKGSMAGLAIALVGVVGLSVFV